MNRIISKEEFDRETARLGAIIELHVDDAAWLLDKAGIACGENEHYKYRHIGLRLDRKKISDEIANKNYKDQRDELLATLTELRDVLKTVPAMQHNKYDSLGIRVNNIIAKCEQK